MSSDSKSKLENVNIEDPKLEIDIVEIPKLEIEIVEAENKVEALGR